MYRVGELGDCFLLRFRDGSEHSSVLIDCGSFRNNKTSVARMRRIAEHIETTLEGRPLDVVVGTHQHNDHLSGFRHAQDVFLRMKAKEGWLSWLDEPGNKNAERIEEEVRGFTKTLTSIRTALSKTDNTGASFRDTAEKLHDLMGFYFDEEEEDPQPAGTSKKPPVVPADGLKVLKAMSDKVSYLRPGEELVLPGIGSEKVKVHVLGPPENDGLLFDIHAKKDETYDPHLKSVHETAKGFLLAMSNFDRDEQTHPDEAYFPFDRTHQKPVSDARFQKSNYFSNDWQRIGTDWLYQSERLALYLDSYTNNTSLVLAFELVESGKVLLFVGDAQTGNWLSWDTITWKDKPVGFHVNNLLSKTVFYKVGHHCSHNATLVSGLERMSHPELIAMIPVDKTDPNIKKTNGWKMPAKNLHQRLKEKTQYRLIRMDDVYDADCDPRNPDNTDAIAAWGKVPVDVTIDESPDPLFVECTMK
jgi:beta-lactamase superfamily II metal-dependent hydrolase